MNDFEDLEEKIISQSMEADGEQIGELIEIVLNTREQCGMMEQFIKKQIEVKDEMIDKLYKELEYYKQEATGRFVDHLMKSVIKVRKDMERLKESDKWSGISNDELKTEYTYVYEDLTDLLEQHNIDAYRTEVGAYFDASIHQAKIEGTDNIQLDKKIKQSLSAGYKKGDKVLQPERVIAFQYKIQE